jgi:filamentous hemagglutinin
MTLIGKNYAGYGQFLDDNFIHLLENSANTTAPTAPLTGQLLWDSTNTLLKIYSGTAWKSLGVTTASSSQPSPSIIGDLWYDTVNQQLKVCSVAGSPGTFIVVGPAYSSAQGTSGAVPITISDGSTGYIVTGLYANNNLVGIISGATDFVPAGNSSGYATAFPKIYKGFTVWNTGNASGNISNPGNITLAVAGSVIETVASTGSYITGLITASGNVIGANIFTAGAVSAGGNVTGLNFIGNVIPPAGGAVSTTGNITGGNILTSGLISATGNTTAGNLITAGLLTVTGNVQAGNLRTAGLITATGNVDAGNIRTAGLISATGNITGGNVLYGSGLVSGTGNVHSGYIFGNGSQLTGVSAAVSVTKFQNGTTEGNAGSSGGNINFNIGGTSNVVVITTTGAVVSGLSTPSIDHTGTNAVGNIGSSSSYFNRLFATATTALYADVAERFAADEELAAGTVVELGGVAEITRSQQDLSENVFGVISTRAAYLMNGGAGEDNTHPPVAMTGRVPVQVIGVVRKGDRLVSAGSGMARAAQPGEATAFNVIGRALVDKLTPGPGTIEAIVTIK